MCVKKIDRYLIFNARSTTEGEYEKGGWGGGGGGGGGVVWGGGGRECLHVCARDCAYVSLCVRERETVKCVKMQVQSNKSCK